MRVLRPGVTSMMMAAAVAATALPTTTIARMNDGANGP